MFLLNSLGWTFCALTLCTWPIKRPMSDVNANDSLDHLLIDTCYDAIEIFLKLRFNYIWANWDISSR